MTAKTFAPKFQGSALIKEIELIAVAGKKLDERIQSAALSVLFHIDSHSDVTVAVKLFGALPKGARKNALAEWFLAHGKVALNTDASTKKDLPFLFDKTRSTNLDGAIAMPWYTFKPEKPVDQVFDFGAMLGALLSKAEKAQASGKEVKGADVLARVLAARVEAHKGSEVVS